MKRNYYIFSSGKLIRRQNTLYFEPSKTEEPAENENEEIIEVEDESTDEKLEEKDRKSTRLNSSHTDISRMPSSA